MQQALCDAHCHPCDKLSKTNLSVVNGTSPSNWETVIKLARSSHKIIPAIGLHPWQVNEVADNWQAQFLDTLSHVQVIGEIGLDYCVSNYNKERQEAALCWQLKHAAQRNLPVTLHCIRASGTLLNILERETIPECGFHLHAYSGSAEQVMKFVELGAYFSFHAGQLNQCSKRLITAIQSVPLERILLETDAPDTISESSNTNSFLMSGYKLLAAIKNMSFEAIHEQVDSNFRRLFTNDRT